VQRVNRGGRGGRGGAYSPRERSGLRDERLEHAAGFEPAQIGIVGQGADHCITEPRTVPGEIAGEDRRRLVERRLLEQREQPALREVLGAREQLVNRGIGNGPGAAAPWGTLKHSGAFITHPGRPRASHGWRGRSQCLAMAQELLSIDQARERTLAAAQRLSAETIPISEALDRVLAEGISAAGDVPPFACSAMDGYALIDGPGDRRLSVVAESRAGAPSQHAVLDGEAVRISTGAAVPPGATAVVRQEDTSATDGTVLVQTAIVPGQNIRKAGEDMRAGASVLAAGARLGAAELGAAVAAGAGQLSVTRRPWVAVLPTGDELLAAGAPLGPGQIHNSNGPMLSALAAHAGAAPQPAAQLPDDAEATEAGLAAALETSDVVIVSGGVSVGPHDHVKPALARLGVTEIFWGVALQPGKPTWFGTKDGTLVFGLPGNPVSAVVTFSLFVAPALASLLGTPAPVPPHPSAVLAADVRSNPAREQAVRVRLQTTGATVTATTTGAQDSHIVTSLLGADALALIPPSPEPCRAGTEVRLAHLAR
jgi:molybdopterin molybdotransferase